MRRDVESTGIRVLDRASASGSSSNRSNSRTGSFKTMPFPGPRIAPARQGAFNPEKLGRGTLMRITIRALAITVVSVLAAHDAVAQSDPVADFYKSHTLTLVSGFTPNGENDIQLRLLGRFIGKYIPGQPQAIVSNMPGAGTLLAANNLVKAPADGATIAMFTSQAATEPFLGNTAAMFDPLKLSWIGSMSQDRQFCALIGTPGGVGSFADLLQKEVLFGSSAPATDIFKYSVALKNLLGAKMKLVAGYPGMPAIRLAMDRGEVNGVCGVSEMILRTNLAEALGSGQLKLIVQMGRTTTNEFGQVPSVFEYTKDPKTTELLDFFFRALAIGRPIAGPAGIPADRLAALRKAFGETLRDEGFLAEAQKIGMSINIATAQDIQSQMELLSRKPKEFYAEVKRVSE
jgi:tripartite-type tricarboxylate transporter receptor subunit TctC